MRILTPEHRRKLSASRAAAWAKTHKRSPGYGDAYRIDVINELRNIICNKCDSELKSSCKSLVREESRNGRLITCMHKVIFVDEDAYPKEKSEL